MKRAWSVTILSAAVLVLGATGVPGSCPGNLQELIDSIDLDAVMGYLESKDFETLDFGGLDVEDEQPFFGEEQSKYEVVPLEDIPPDLPFYPGGATKTARRGILAGRFITDDETASSFDSPGVFRGRWANADRTVTGYLRGTFRPVALEDGDKNNNGPEQHPAIVAKGQFHGKYIDVDGKFHGILRGLYAKLEDGRSFFAGKWIGAHGEVHGGLRGTWEDREDVPGGVFKGRWVRFPVREETPDLEAYEFEEGDFGGLTTDDEQPFFGEDPQLYPPLAMGGLIPPEELDPDLPNCPHGTLAGWFRGENGGPSWVEPGTLRGRWISANQTVTGLLKGHYRPLDQLKTAQDQYQNGGVFYGKYISTGEKSAETAGEFRGMIRGRYGVLPNGNQVFLGMWFDTALEEKGILGGHWHDIPELDRGVFKGRWGEFCNPPE